MFVFLQLYSLHMPQTHTHLQDFEIWTAWNRCIETRNLHTSRKNYWIHETTMLNFCIKFPAFSWKLDQFLRIKEY